MGPMAAPTGSDKLAPRRDVAAPMGGCNYRDVVLLAADTARRHL
jgi:hypothetical protein